jgi:uncharacterized protein
MNDQHKSHPEIINRLKRTEGHLRTIILMIEEGRACVELAQQLHAAERAVAAAKKTLIHDHFDHCLDHATESRAAVAEFKQLTKYL